MGTAIVLTSGKGGTGKTTCSGAIASALASLGHPTVCVDCDIGLRNLDLALGVTDFALWDFSDVIDGHAKLSDATISHPDIQNLYFLAAPAGLSPEDINPHGMKELVDKLKSEYEYCIIDCPAGLGAGFKLSCIGADMAIIVSTGDAASLRDCQRTVAALSAQGIENVRLLVNRLSPRMLRQTRATVDDVIDVVGAQLLGLVSEDESVALAANFEKPLLVFGAKYAYDQFFRIARRITGERVPLGKA